MYPEAATVLADALQRRPRSDTPDANQQVLIMHRALYGERHPEVVEDLNNLGAAQLELGNLGLAGANYRECLSITEAWHGPQNPKVAEDLTSLGRTLIRDKRYADAKPLLERALRYADAERRFSEALQIWRTIYGSGHQFIGVGLSNLGSVYMAEKQYKKAEAMYWQALQVFIATVQEGHTNTGIAHLKLGRALLRQKRYKDAESETLQGYETLAKLVPPSTLF